MRWLWSLAALVASAVVSVGIGMVAEGALARMRRRWVMA